MATQRITLAKVVGRAAPLLGNRLSQREKVEFRIRPFAETLRANSMRPPVVYFGEWIDSWSMGGIVPALDMPGAVVIREGSFEACCHPLPIQFDRSMLGDALESDWLRARVAEAEATWSDVGQPAVLIIIREVFGGSILDEEWLAGFHSVPDWFSPPE